ncbi:probable WRKY transcription factor 41 [Actinidia eriantha]|uniref:probable WRKY transcription factor 41 n=1 Tax=Actinidia eriantha TaxID=165200 RepID=UPI00258B0A17|nr:probable WRKY transcription factor 41 [Actinidia eriantha]
MEETLINELVQGMELTKQLKNHLDPLASSPESCDFLIQKILSSYDKALSMLNLVGELHQVAGILGPSSQSSPGSENFDPDLNDQCPRDVYKKRKTLPRWTEQVSVCSETGLVTGDDGYNWRKYGQKDILGANFPRAYYRCTHRGTQGCLATKQVQRSDTNPLIFEITYRGRHTCIQTSQEIPAFASTGKEFPNQNKGPSSLGRWKKEKST